MKKIIFLIFASVLSVSVWAQPDGIGQSGALQLVINSWGQSSGLMGIDVASTTGIEGNGINPAGIAKTDATELVFTHTRWNMGSETRINTLGFSQALGGGGTVLGLTVSAFDLGDLIRTTTDLPDGTLGTFSPSLLNISLSYAKQFTDNIYVGAIFRLISESTPEISATGLAFDAGIQYRTGEKEKIKLGISLRNVGPTMKYGGDGLTQRVFIRSRNKFDSGVEIPSAEFELPVVLSMGGSYDFLMAESHTLTLMGTFISNSFYYDQIGAGIQYNFKDFFMVRGAYLYEDGAFDTEAQRFNEQSGYSLGVTLQAPFRAGRKDAEGSDVYSRFGLDVSYRATEHFDGTLTFGARIDL